MKKFCLLVLLLCLVASLSACGKVEVSMQEIYEAGKTEALLKNHESVSILNEMDGELFSERYLTEEYVCDCFPDEESTWAEFMTDDAHYYYAEGVYVRYLSITPDGVSDFADSRAERYTSAILGEESVEDTIESVSNKDGRLTITSALNPEMLAILKEDGLASAKFEYVLDAETREMLSAASAYTYDDGTVFCTVTEVIYDAETPETVKTFLKYDNQTENLRNVTVVSNPGTGKEVSQSVRIPKGLIAGFRYEEDSADEFKLYTDADCTEPYDPYADTDSDLMIYVKWTNK